MRLRPSRRTRPAVPEDDPRDGVPGPHSVQVEPHAIRVGDGWAATIVVTGYPAQVGPAWLDPVLSAVRARHVRVDDAVHIHPLPAPVAAARLRRARARLEATRRLDVDKGRLSDPTTAVTADDADRLAERLARGETRLFRVGVYLTVHAPTAAALGEAVAHVRAAAASALLDTHPATWQHLQGWTTTLPLGHDALARHRVMDTDALALAFPLHSPDLPAPLPGQHNSGPSTDGGGVLVGVNPTGTGIVWWDRWSLDNHNSLVLARSGAGKSYLVKLDILRSLYAGVRVAVIDPEDEYPGLADAVGGVTVALGRRGVRVNPLDLPRTNESTGAAGEDGDALTRRALFCHTLVAVLLATALTAEERAALDTATATAYQRAGITTDPATWTRPAPLLTDVQAALARAGDPTRNSRGQDAARSLATRLQPWTHGSFKGLFDGPTTHVPDGRLVVWSVRHLPDELRAAGMLLALDAVWRDVDTPAPGRRPVRRLVVVDEAWTLLHEDDGARFLYRLAKAARKRHAGLVVVTQDAQDLLGSDLGQAVAANAAAHVLLRQAPQAVDPIADAFALTPTEARFLRTAPRGHGLLLFGNHRTTFHAVSSPKEHALCRGAGEHDTPDHDGDTPAAGTGTP